MRIQHHSIVKYALAGLITFWAFPAIAAISGDGLLNDVTTRFLTQSATWGATITSYASWLFWTLALISMVWTFGMLALRKADLGDFFAEFVRFTVTTGFFWWLLSNGPQMAIAIVDSLRQIGATAGGLPNTITPSSPISIGFDIVKKAFAGLSWVHPIDNLAIILISLAVVLCMAIVAANLLIALVTAWVMVYAGVFILGFGGARWTSDMAVSYFKTMLGIGLELMTMILLVGIATSVIDGFYTQLDGSSVYELLLVFCVCAVLALLINKIPGRVAALAGGGSGASIGAGSVMGAAAMGAAAAASAGTALAAGGASIAGGTQALMAAFSKANASESAGGGGYKDFMSVASGGGSDSGGGGSGGGSALAAAMGDSGGGSTKDSIAPVGGSPGEQKSGGMASAAGKVGRVAAGTVGNLAQGSWDVAKAKAGVIKGTALNRIGETTGGKIATAIRTSSDEELAFSGDSLGVGKGGHDANDEVAAFTNRTNGGGSENDTSTASGASGLQTGATTGNTKSVFD